MDKVKEAYRENLEITIPSVEKLLRELPGKSVVTADHGETFGERAWPVPIREFGHPRGVYIEELVAVPWHEHTNKPRRKIIKEKSGDTNDSISENVVEKRLSDLGYK